MTRTRKDGAAILFHLEPNGRIVGATGLGTAGSIGRDIRLTQVLIAHRAHPDRAVLMDPEARLKTLLSPDMPLPRLPGVTAAQHLAGGA